ncbi:MAG: hypothetical protein HKN28_12675 [Alphaproteobacteria bacterium]|nr:hypothetical protein [Alphaproteobacteria bacterium]
MSDGGTPGLLFATIAHRKISGEVLTASFDAESPARALENMALLLSDWNPEEDDTTVIRLMGNPTE